MRIEWRSRRFEFFVVAGIIIGLWLLLFVRVSSIKRGEICQNNLKQLSLAMGLYIRDYDELYPPKDKWADAILPHLKDDSIFQCPSTPQYGYALNQILDGINVSEVKNYHTTPLFFETNLLHRNASGGIKAVIHEPRHPQGIGVVFTDQQVSWQQKPSQFPVLETVKPKHPTNE